MGTILVTGATGFVGSRLVRELSAEHDVVALSRRPTTLALYRSAPEADHAVVRGDFTSREELQALDAHEIDTVVHLASEIGGLL